MGNAWTADNAPRYSPLSEQVEKISKSFRSLRHEKTLVVFTTFDPWRARQARLPPTNVGGFDVPSIGAGRKNFKVFPFP